MPYHIAILSELSTEGVNGEVIQCLSPLQTLGVGIYE